ncbi:MAG: hypothetical protein U0903_10825 [Planctomycetales bacterium]
MMPLPSQIRRGGFTLLEVILTVVLASALLAGLWALSGIYMRMFESGQDQIEQAQLLRALTQQIDDDLQGVFPGQRLRRRPFPFSFDSSSNPGQEPSATSIPPDGVAPPTATDLAGDSPSAPSPGEEEEEEMPLPVAASPLSDTTSTETQTTPRSPGPGDRTSGSAKPRLPVFSLKGTETSLELTLLRLVPVEEQPADQQVNQDALISQDGPPKAPEWRIVKYRFTPFPEDKLETEAGTEPKTPLLNSNDPEPGLAREEQSWEESRKAKLARAMTNAALTEEDLDSEEMRPTGEAETLKPETEGLSGEKKEEENSESRMNIPQIVAARFQYFDGQTWLSDWDSTAMRELPQAVEMALQIKPTLAGQREDRKKVETKTAPTETSEENEVFHDPGLEKKGNWPVYRQVWVLRAGVDQAMASRRRFPPPANDLTPLNQNTPAPTGLGGTP